ncbi:MAG: cytochrome c [Candidatus Hydrothermae bacterium]|nr:cytochrome c [Candidatus Hydrothermae bacterium]
MWAESGKKMLRWLVFWAWPVGLLAGPWPFIQNMVDQPSIKPQETLHPLPPEGAVPRGGLWEPKRTWQEGENVPNPLPHTPEVVQRGEELWQRYCTPCHGPRAKAGEGAVSRLWPALTTPDLTTPFYIQQHRDGYYYEIIRQGHVIMPSYGEGTLPADRWAIVHYLRVLQNRSQHP